MSRHRGAFASHGMFPNRMAATFSVKIAIMLLEMLQQVTAFHGVALVVATITW
jgi:hypothetical protein